MSRETTIFCGPCCFVNRNNQATTWCTDCEEGFCQNCETVHISSKMTRDHKLISIEDYNKIAHIEVSQTCEHHNKRLELYCKTHDVALCLKCVPSSHKTCPDILMLEEAARDAKRSAVLANLEETIESTIKTFAHITVDRDSAVKVIEKEEQAIKNIIRETRQNINKHLDELEQNLLLELAEKSKHSKSEIEKVRDYIKSMEENFNRLKDQTLQLKMLASDLLVFLGTRQISKVVNEHIELAKTHTASLKNYKVGFEMNTDINMLISEKDFFGKLKIIETEANVKVKEGNTDHAQAPATNMQSIQDIQICMKHEFKIKKEGEKMLISGCIILPSGCMLVADFWGKKLIMEYSDEGKHLRDMPVSNNPFDLALIDSERISVSYGGSQYVEIINMQNNIVDHKLKFTNSCWGISHQDGKLYIVQKGIVVTDLTGNTICTIECDVSKVYYLTTTKDRIYYTDYQKNTINCCSLTGEEIWVFKDESLNTPHGISADNNQNVFSVGRTSDNLLIIKEDGTISKTILSKSDGMDNPRTLYYDKVKRVLFVANVYSGQAFLYNFI